MAQSIFGQLLPPSIADVLLLIILIVIGIVFFILFRSAWIHWRQEIYKRTHIKWILMEIKIPREIRKSPQAMEQVLNAIYALRNAPSDLRERYWDGEVTRWYSLEMVSFGGETSFYIRFHERQRGLIEAAFFSYYPDVELTEVSDYVNKFPTTVQEMRDQGYDLWAAEMTLIKPAAYPIKTYPYFIESPDEEKQFDTMSSFLEVLSKINREEIVGLQILIAPASFNWKNEFQDLVSKLKERKTAAVAQAGPEGQVQELTKTLTRTPGETEVLKAVEGNLAKNAFDSVIRFIYLSPRHLYHDTFPRRGISGAFSQFNTLDLNSILINYKTATKVSLWRWPHLFPKTRNEYRKHRFLYNYRHRELPLETFIGKLITSKILNWNFPFKTVPLTTEEVASIFHPPTRFTLTAPHIRRIESRRAGPPAGLAIFGEEGSIERYLGSKE